MAFMKMSKDLDIISNMKDRPWESPNGLSTAEIKAKFDEAGKLLKNFINSFIDDLAKSTAASNIGATVKDGESRTATNIQAVLDTLIDGTSSAKDGSVKTDSIEDGAVKTSKIYGGAVTTVKLDNYAVTTEKIAEHAISHVYTQTLTAAGWTGTSAPFTQEVTISGILANDEPIIDVVLSGTYETAMQEDDQWGNIYKASTAANKITFYAKDKPTVALSFKARCIRK